MSEIEIKIIGYLWEFFSGDALKVAAWLRADNLNFGGMKPIQLMRQGREHKLLRFIETARDENGLNMKALNQPEREGE